MGTSWKSSTAAIALAACCAPCAASAPGGALLAEAKPAYRGVFSAAGSFQAVAEGTRPFASAYRASAAPSGAMVLAGLALLGLIVQRRLRALRPAEPL